MNQMMTIGPSFGDELLAVGLGGLPITWGADGVWWKNLSPSDEAKLQGVMSAHNPNTTPSDPRAQARTALQAATSIAQLKAALLELV